jgi:beta-galactosidase
MRHLFIFFLFLASFCQGRENHFLFAYFTDNGQDGLHLAYSSDGLTWKELNNGKSLVHPTVGNDKLMRDPFILKGVDGLFHMVWTCSWNERQIGYASSKDLINWSEQKAIPVMAHEPTAKNCWAPEMVYDPQNKNYLIFWATTIPGRHTAVAVTESEKGWNHRMYCTTTSDFKLFSPTKLFFNPDFSVIDATVFRKKKTYYLLIKNENPNPPEKNIRVTSSRHAAGPYPTLVSPPITGKYWAEGPTAIGIGKYVYVYFDKYRDHRYGAVRSTNMKDWEDISEKIIFPKGVRHGTVIKVSGEVFEKLTKMN